MDNTTKTLDKLGIKQNDERLFRKFGTDNPTVFTENDVWMHMVKTRQQAYDLSGVYTVPCHNQPVWCNQRFGQTRTVITLNGGCTLIFIGGEHEDSYDPDFMIYDDVIVETRADNQPTTFNIYG